MKTSDLSYSSAEAWWSDTASLAATPQVQNDDRYRQRQAHHHDIREEKLACIDNSYKRDVTFTFAVRCFTVLFTEQFGDAREVIGPVFVSASGQS